jgi:hypothetical protein
LVGIGVLIIGTYIILYKKYLQQVVGTVIKASADNCLRYMINNESVNTCMYDVTFKVDGIEYTQAFPSTKTYYVGDTVDIMYNPFAPQQSELNPLPKMVGWVLIGLGGFLLFGAVVMLWVTKSKSK